MDEKAERYATTFTFRRDAGRICISGEIDMKSVAVVRPVVLAGTDPIELDLSDVTFMDSSGIKLLVLAKLRRGVRLVATSAAVDRLLELTGLTDEFT